MSKNHHPPKWAKKFLHWFCAEELIEEIEGDLMEAYDYRRQNHSKLKADWWFIQDVLRFFKPYSFEKYSRTKQFMPMFNNYLKVSFRNIIKRKAFTSINLLGLGIGITAAFLVGLYINHEVTYDQSIPDADNIHRLVNQYRDQTYSCMYFKDYYDSDPSVQLGLIDHISQYEEVVSACHFVPNKSSIGPNQKYYVTANNKELVMDDLLYTNTGSAFQAMFPQTFIQGTPENAYGQYKQVVLTSVLAQRIYGKSWKSQEIIGEALHIGEEPYLIAGVVEEMPGNVHFGFGMIVYQESIPSWGAYTYFKTKPSAQPESVVHRLNREVDLVYPGYEEDELSKGILSIPMTALHFTDGTLYELKAIANVDYLYTFGVVGLVILLIIWTNYANLSIATYAGRQKELGIRKVMGAHSGDVTLQVLVEAILLTLICLPITWGLVYLLLPLLNELMGVEINRSLLTSPFTLLVFFLVHFVTGLISGLYPALVFGKKSMIKLFDHNVGFTKTKSIFQFRRVLLTLQFFMLIGLMSLAIIIMQQMNFIQEKPTGYEKEGVIFFSVQGAEKYQRLMPLITSIPEVEAVGNGVIPGANMYNQLTYKMQNTDETLADGTHLYTSFGSMKVLGIESAAFDLLENGQDSVFVINQTAARKLAAIKGVAINDLIGETLIMEPEYENETWGNGIHFNIAAIIDDFDYFSLKYESQPLLLEVHRNPGWIYNMLIRANTDNWVSTITKIEKAYMSIENERPFDVTFLDNHLERLYRKERNAGQLASGLTVICIVLSVMGLVGIVGFITLTRRKEIGVRKVFGASVSSILAYISREYVVMMIVATLIAIPASTYLAGRWLENFAYRIDPSFLVVVLSGLITLFIVLTVVILQSYQTAKTNPSGVLRYE